MANNRLSMRKITEALRLHFGHDRTNPEIVLVIDTSPLPAGSIGGDHPPRARLGIGASRDAQEGRHPRPAVARNKADHSDGYLYRWFCDHCREWASKPSVSLRQTHTPARRCRSLMVTLVKKSVRHDCSSPSSAHLTTPMQRRSGHRSFQIGSALMSKLSSSLAVS